MSERLDARVERLVGENVRLAHYIANRYRDSGLDPHEALSRALAGLHTAAIQFKPSRGKFGSWASQKINWSVKTGLRELNTFKARAWRSSVSLDQQSYDDGKTLGERLADTRPDDESDRARTEDLAREVAGLIVGLNDKQRDVVTAMFGVGCEPQDVEAIARRLKVSVARVYQIRDVAISKLRIRLAERKARERSKE